VIIQNAVFIPSTGEIYKSWHRHDYVDFDVEGQSYFIDGGNEYIRTSVLGDHPHIKWICLYDDDDIQLVIDTYVSKDDKGNNKFVKSMSIPELERVLERMKHPLVQEALTIMISQKSSLLDMIIEPHE
jgi:hypothetical protein